MNSYVKNVMHHFCSTWEYKTILAYLFIGLLFIVPQSSGLGYFQMFMNSFTNKIFLTVVFYPSFVAMFFSIYQYINKSDTLFLRLPDRKSYAKVCLLTIVVTTIFLFVITLLLTFICCNITAHQDFKITSSLHYPVNDLIIFLIQVVKIFLTAFLIGLLTLFLFFQETKNSLMAIVLMTLLTLIFFGDKWYPTKFMIVNVLNPGFQSHGYALTNDFSFFLISGFVYFGIFISLLIFFIFRSSKKVTIGVDLK